MVNINIKYYKLAYYMCICNATQRIPQLYLNNNFKFYISQCIFFYKRIQILRSFFYREKRTKKATSFCQKEAKTTPFRIRNSLIKIFSQYLESPSLRVRLKYDFVERSNIYKLDCHDFGRSLSMTVKNSCHYEAIAEVIQSNLDCHANARNDSENNFAILNLIKSFLTSFTFDNLSERIKNLYLVINQFNFFTKGGYSHEEYQNNFHLHGRRSFSYGFIYKL